MSAATAPRPITYPLPRPSRRRRARRQRPLGGGAVGHILRNRTIDPETYEATDRWFHYNQVGSVMATSNTSGNLVSRRFADAFGNAIDSSTMAWAGRSAGAGWGHNTKEHDATTGFVYMYHRWYQPETGTFLSTAPYPPMMEHPYTFAAGNPVGMVDPDGRLLGIFATAVTGIALIAPTIPEALENSRACRQAVREYENIVSNGNNPHRDASTDLAIQCMYLADVRDACGDFQKLLQAGIATNSAASGFISPGSGARGAGAGVAPACCEVSEHMKEAIKFGAGRLTDYGASK